MLFLVICIWAHMSPQDKDQIVIIIKNIDIQKKKVPFLTDLQAHPIYGKFFEDLDSEDILEVQELIDEYIKNKILNPKTKWWEMFQRFYVLNQDAFWEFRRLQAHEENIDTDAFQTLWRSLEKELFKFENILTQNMMKKPQWLDKVVSAYYDIVHSFFPYFSRIG